MADYGLIGKTLSHSFSKAYFEKKFLDERLNNHHYYNFELTGLEGLTPLIERYRHLRGLNVTIPYKQEIIAHIDELDEIAKQIGAVNTIKINRSFEGVLLKGFNTDLTGFQQSLLPLISHRNIKFALVLGSGGASKAIQVSLKRLGIEYKVVSRNSKSNLEQISYDDLSPSIIQNAGIIINCTPLGKYPDAGSFPDIPYQYILPGTIAYDLNYNPETTAFLSKAAIQNCVLKNGLEMLHLQAEASWNIWNT